MINILLSRVLRSYSYPMSTPSPSSAFAERGTGENSPGMCPASSLCSVVPPLVRS